ncbi:WD repeat-containing protein 37-like protein, partial [Leptotrombidium deliense]
YGLVITASGDSGAHIWAPELHKVNINDAIDNSVDDEKVEQQTDETHLIKQPLLRLSGHSSVVISCDWLSTVDQCVTASWDRTADIYDINTGELIVQLMGHDQELTDVEAHSSAPLIVTSSHDTTFRLWDFREAIHSVSVFQGHVDCVTSATFLGTDKVVSGSDDRTVKVWDLKNMRSPLTSIYVEAPINKLGVSQQHNYIAIPLENRNVRLYDCNGNRICRLPRNHHERMVTCVAFAAMNASPCNAMQACSPSLPYTGIQLFTCGFDRKVCHWSINASDHKS